MISTAPHRPHAHPCRTALLACCLVFAGLGHAEGEPDDSPSGVIERTEASLGFLTLRKYNPEADPGDRFGGERGTLQAGLCHTETAGLSWLRDANLVSPIALPEGFTDIVAVERRPLSALETLIDPAPAAVRPTLYVHGYNEGFSRACRRATQLKHALDRAHRMLLFTWPSDGNPARYTHDETDAGWSEAGLADAIEQMAATWGHGGFDVIAHSLGSRVVMRAAAAFGYRAADNNPIIHQLVFVAPDVDAGLFSHKSAAVRLAAGRVSVIANDQDLPLMLSEELHGAPRLGQVGPHLDALAGVDVYDLSELSMRGSTGHLYHLNHPRVHALLKRVLAPDAPVGTPGQLTRLTDD
ncbi:MAG: alpha/beta hydrolase [Pseudomonadota bacterium]